jgi:hypothetical protein
VLGLVAAMGQRDWFSSLYGILACLGPVLVAHSLLLRRAARALDEHAAPH